MSENKLNVVFDTQKSVPKYATNVVVMKLSNGSIIFQFMSKIPQESPINSEAGDTAAVIETILVDEDHAKKIMEAIQTALTAEVSNVSKIKNE